MVCRIDVTLVRMWDSSSPPISILIHLLHHVDIQASQDAEVVEEEGDLKRAE